MSCSNTKVGISQISCPQLCESPESGDKLIRSTARPTGDSGCINHCFFGRSGCQRGSLITAHGCEVCPGTAAGSSSRRRECTKRLQGECVPNNQWDRFPQLVRGRTRIRSVSKGNYLAQSQSDPETSIFL